MGKSIYGFLFIAMSVLIISVSGNTEEAKRTKAVSIDPLIFGRIGFQYESLLSRHSSWMMRGSYGYIDHPIINAKYTVHGIGAAYRKYPYGNALNGVYFGLFGEARFISIVVDDYPNKGTVNRIVLGPGIEFGKQWIEDNGVLTDLGLSLHYYFGNTEAKVGDTTAKVNLLSGTGYGIRLAAGYAW